MEWSYYKVLCDQPDYWSRWMLEQCVDLLEQLEKPHLHGLLSEAMHTTPLAVPADHKGALATQMFKLSLSKNQRLEILTAIESAVEGGLATQHTANRGLGGFIQAWQEYVHYED
jgi:hypothetical protein